MANVAESKLALVKYYGEKRRYNFESYISTLNKQFRILNNLCRYGYARIDEASKVRRLNSGIKTDKLDAPKVKIILSRALQDNFDDSVGLYQDFIAPSTAQGENTNFTVGMPFIFEERSGCGKRLKGTVPGQKIAYKYR